MSRGGRGRSKSFIHFALLRYPYCQWCGRRVHYHYHRGRTHPPENSATCDHLIPVSKGGKKGWDNRVLSCWTCNNKRGNDLPNCLPHGPKWDEELKRFFAERAAGEEFHRDAADREILKFIRTEKGLRGHEPLYREHKGFIHYGEAI